MKAILLVFALAFAPGLRILAQAAPAPAKHAPVPMQAELLRSTTGRTMGDKGLPDGIMQLKKGMIFDVLDQAMGIVVVSANNRNVKLASTEVRVTPKPGANSQPGAGPDPQPAAGNFTPGQIVLLKATYTLEAGPARTVKNRLEKLIPSGVITEPVKILVSDALHSTAAAQDNTATGTITAISSTTAIIRLKGTARNILTVQYMFNGQTKTQQVMEGDYLVLP